MKIFNKAGERFSEFFGVSDDDEKYEENIPFMDEELEEIIIEKTFPLESEQKTTRHKSQDFITEKNNSRKSKSQVEGKARHDLKNLTVSELENKYTNEKIVEMNNYQTHSNGNNRMVVAKQHRKVTVYLPRDYIDCKQIAQALFRKEIIILSFRLMEEQPARRVVDFMTGAVYAIDGDIQRLGDDIFICTPANVDVDSSITHNIFTNDLTEY